MGKTETVKQTIDQFVRHSRDENITCSESDVTANAVNNQKAT